MSEECKREQFQNKKYIRLETVKRNGQVVPTPVWFVVEDDTLFVRSYVNTLGPMSIAARSNACVMTLMFGSLLWMPWESPTGLFCLAERKD